jgi:hypothetical protein
MHPDSVIHIRPACEPEWVALNPLVSYCAKSVLASSAATAEESAAMPGQARCTHAGCLFRMRD